MQVLIFEGVYFGEQQHLSSELALNGFEVKVVNLDHSYSEDFEAELEKAQLVILRSRWSASVEESVLTKLYSKKYSAYVKSLSKSVSEKKVKLLLIGRGALFGLSSELLSATVDTNIKWKALNFLNKTWVDTSIRTKGHTKLGLRALLSGRAIPQGLNPCGDLKIEPWAKDENTCYGWSVGTNIYLSFVDLLSLSERAQLPDYGYEDLSGITNRIAFLNLFQSGEL